MSEIENISKIIEEVSPHYKKLRDKKLPTSPEEHKLIYDSSSETLEPVYFWILDRMNATVGDVEKLIDNFSSSPGGGHFAEIQQRATIMQQQATKILGDVNTVIKSILNIIYDLKEFQIRLSHYKAANSSKKEEAEAGVLALKQIWMDNVDIKRGTGSMNALSAGNLQFVTLRDAFMAAKSPEDVDDMDLNDRVKRILKPRIQEFFEWKKRSEIELKKRYEIERTYLKSQVSALKLYTRWAKPYLRAASQLEQKDTKNPALVTAFNTIILQLTLLGKKEVKFEEAIYSKELPRAFEHVKLKRKYYSCVLVDFYFRGIPQRVSQQAHYVFGGRVEVTFKGYALNEDELKMLEKKLDESDFNEALRLVEATTTESLAQLQSDLDYFLSEEKKGEEKEKKGEDINPFSALLGLGGKKEEKKKEEKKILKIRPDDYTESVLRKLAEKKSKVTTFGVFDVYKKSHGMASYPSPFE